MHNIVSEITFSLYCLHFIDISWWSCCLFLIFNNIFVNKFYSLVAPKKSMTNICAVFGCKANFRTQKQKKIISNLQSVIKFLSKWLELMNTLLFLTKRFDWGTTTTIYLCDAMWPSPSLSQFSAWSENIYGKHHC